LSRCLGLAAVGSDDLDNIAVAVAAAAVSPRTRVVVRAGEHEAIAETRSLLPLGVIRDVTEMAATFVVAVLLGRNVRGAVAGSRHDAPSDTCRRLRTLCGVWRTGVPTSASSQRVELATASYPRAASRGWELEHIRHDSRVAAGRDV
jgi:hypothetical protein